MTASKKNTTINTYVAGTSFRFGQLAGTYTKVKKSKGTFEVSLRRVHNTKDPNAIKVTIAKYTPGTARPSFVDVGFVPNRQGFKLADQLAPLMDAGLKLRVVDADITYNFRKKDYNMHITITDQPGYATKFDAKNLNKVTRIKSLEKTSAIKVPVLA